MSKSKDTPKKPKDGKVYSIPPAKRKVPARQKPLKGKKTK